MSSTKGVFSTLLGKFKKAKTKEITNFIDDKGMADTV